MDDFGPYMAHDYVLALSAGSSKSSTSYGLAVPSEWNFRNLIRWGGGWRLMGNKRPLDWQEKTR
jgi:hypothetical protein